MNLSGIVSVSGKPGLWKALSQNKTGFILESLDEHKTKLIANLSTAKLAALDEITLFGYEEDLKLTDVFGKMKAAGNAPDAKADGKILRAYFKEVAPDHDEEKVYASDIKKVISWYNILKEMPIFSEEAPVAASADVEKPVAKASEKPKPIEKKAAPATRASKSSIPKTSAKRGA